MATKVVVYDDKGEAHEESVLPATRQEWAADNVGNTRRWARQLHGDQKEKSGKPYVSHLDAVAKNLYGIMGCFDQEMLQAAYLHDVLEDTAADLVDLEAEGYSDLVIDTVLTVTKRPGSLNYKYIGQVIEGGEEPMLVKLADLRHNTDPGRLALLDKATQKRLLKKYLPAIWRIESVLLRLDAGWVTERTVTFEQAREACQAYVPQWYSYTIGKHFTHNSILVGDFFKFDKNHQERQISHKRVTAKGNIALRFTKSTKEVILQQGDTFLLRYKPGGSGDHWTDYLGLPKGYEVVGDEDVNPPEDVCWEALMTTIADAEELAAAEAIDRLAEEAAQQSA